MLGVQILLMSTHSSAFTAEPQLQYRLDRAVPDLILHCSVHVSTRCCYWPSVHLCFGQALRRIGIKVERVQAYASRYVCTRMVVHYLSFYIAKITVQYSTFCLKMNVQINLYLSTRV